MGKGQCRVNGQSQRRAARDVEREMGTDVDPGQANSGDGGQGEDAGGWAEAWKSGSAQSDGDAGMPGRVSQAGRVGAAAAGAWEQDRRPGPAHHPFDQFRERPRGGAAGESRPASSRSPASHAAPADAGAAPRVPSCMMTQAGGYSESGRPLTARNAVASYRLTRLRRAAAAVASTATVPAASRTRGSASTPAGERVGFLAEDRGGAGVAGPIRSLAVVNGVMDARVFHTAHETDGHGQHLPGHVRG